MLTAESGSCLCVCRILFMLLVGCNKRECFQIALISGMFFLCRFFFFQQLNQVAFPCNQLSLIFCFSVAKHLWLKRSFFLRTVLLCFYAVSLSCGITKHENLGWQLPNHIDDTSHPAEKALLCAVTARKVLRINARLFSSVDRGLQCNSNPMLNSCLVKCRLAGTVFT